MSTVQPIVSGPRTNAAGKKYMSGPLKYNPHNCNGNSNKQSWAVIQAMYGLADEIDFWDLCVAIRHHKHGTKGVKGPQSFVRYLIRNQHLQEI